ncbi:MAG: NAD-dependent epimerase/dehydratase family protein [Betaproteobacteria bacterium]|nr:NAD-dependent epimerase/dehydratase family protein [Betaproteobacteria bacterium]
MKAVFLTGATGAIGSALAPLYLDEPDTRLALLLRAKRGRDVTGRLQELGQFWGLEKGDGRWQRIEAIVGDASRPRFGIADEQYERLSRSTTHIVHCAGAVKMTLPLEEARAHAVVPARSALDLADACHRAGKLHAVDIVSTVGVGGRTPGVIPERPMPEVRAFHNTYEQAKAEAEHLVFDRWADLPVTVHRPSMVVGESGSGKIIHFQVFYHLCEFLSGQRTYGLMPVLQHATLDTIPADYVSKAIHWSSHNPGRQRILHLCSGSQNAVPLPTLVDHVRVRAERAGSRLPRVRYVPLAVFRIATPVLALIAPAKVKRALSSLDLFLAYLEELQTFDNANTRALLGPEEIRVPAVESYLDRVLDYYHEKKASSTSASIAVENEVGSLGRGHS